ncbi:MAG: glycosyltransferase [Flavobacteriales bacterium]|nr:glycosyltransferase [Flavobacteriales bacterium]
MAEKALVKRVLVVGQTPPPHGGQAIMIERLLKGSFTQMELFHVRMAFSEDMESVGKAGLRKVWVLIRTILAVWVGRFRFRTTILYYPPAGPNRVPVLRDLALLGATRFLFRHTVFHFHAGGVSTYREQFGGWLRPLFDLAYGRPDLTIRTAPQNPDDGAALGTRRDVVVPNGMEDKRGSVEEHSAGPGEPLVLLFTGVLVRSKGIRVLIEAFINLCQQGAQLNLRVMGRWADATLRAECETLLGEAGLLDRVVFLGVLDGLEKEREFAQCDIFCFPSYFEAESFGLVLVEAMQYAKPVVSTRWRGIPSVVQDGVSGYLVEVRDSGALAERISRLVKDPLARHQMGSAGRRIFEERFTLKAFHRAMEEAIAAL